MKIDEYLERYGIKQRWLAKQLGLSFVMFNRIINGTQKLPRKYWTDLVLLTDGKVTVEDLTELENMYEKFESAAFQKKYVRERRNSRQLSAPSQEVQR